MAPRRVLRVRRRRLSRSERAFADRIFAGTLPADRVLLTDRLGWAGRAFTLPLPGGSFLVAVGDGYDDPVHYDGTGRGPRGTRAPGQLLVHELVHVWQMARAPRLVSFMASAVALQLRTVRGDMSAYRYDAAGRPWNAYGMEQQASIVDQWYAGRRDPRSAQSSHPPMHEHEANPYWRYVRDNLRRPVP